MTLRNLQDYSLIASLSQYWYPSVRRPSVTRGYCVKM